MSDNNTPPTESTEGVPVRTGKRGRKPDAKPAKREKRSYATELAEMTTERDVLQERIRMAVRVLRKADDKTAFILSGMVLGILDVES